MAIHERPGPDPPVVLLHGTGCSADDFRALLDALPGVHAFCPEFRGHGDSDASPADFTLDDLVDDVLAALDALDLRRVVLVGHSLGGMVGLRVARGSSRVVSLVLLEGWTRLFVVRRAFSEAHMYGDLSPDVVSGIRRKSERVKQRHTKERWDAFWRTVVTFDGTQSLEELRMPIHQVYGSAGTLEDARRHLAVPDRPNIRWTWVSGAGHYLPLEAPRAVADVIRESLH